MSLYLLTYNVRLPELNLDAPKNGLLQNNRKRARMMLEALLDVPDDVFVLTEVFATDSGRDILVEGPRRRTRVRIPTLRGWRTLFGPRVGPREGGLTSAGFDVTQRPKQESRWRNGGVMIASRYPIVREATRVYDTRERTGFNSQPKGAVYAKIRKDGSNWHIFGTHLQHGCKDEQKRIRAAQLGELVDFVEEQNIPSGESIVLAGDFNIGYNRLKRVGTCGGQRVDTDLVDVLRDHGLYTYTLADTASREPTTLEGTVLDHALCVSTGFLTHTGAYETYEWYTRDRLPELYRGMNASGERVYFLSDHHPVSISIDAEWSPPWVPITIPRDPLPSRIRELVSQSVGVYS